MRPSPSARARAGTSPAYARMNGPQLSPMSGYGSRNRRQDPTDVPLVLLHALQDIHDVLTNTKRAAANNTFQTTIQTKTKRNNAEPLTMNNNKTNDSREITTKHTTITHILNH